MHGFWVANVGSGVGYYSTVLGALSLCGAFCFTWYTLRTGSLLYVGGLLSGVVKVIQ